MIGKQVLWFQFLMGIMQMGNMSFLLSENLMSGFSTAAACHVMVSQLKNITGIPIGTYTGNFKVPYVSTFISCMSGPQSY